jgi:enoyl-CoA hydratase/carnithine racemase
MANGLITEVEGQVGMLTLARPGARNALSLELIEALRLAIAALSAQPDIRAIVLAGEGPVFCAGHDLSELQARRQDPDQGRAFYARVFGDCSRLMTEIRETPQPVIAAVDGVATAAGCQLVAACDLAVAGRSSRFAAPGVNIGLFCSTPAVALARSMHPKHAMEMLLTGEMWDADQAFRVGLINRICPAGAARGEAVRLAAAIAARSPQAIAFGKRAFYRQLGADLVTAYAIASETMVDNALAADAREGFAAFLEKRPPEWPSSR